MMAGIFGNLALKVEVHKTFSEGELGRIYPLIEPPFPERAPYIEPGTAAMGKNIDGPPIARVRTALAEERQEEYNILVLENIDGELSRIIQKELVYKSQKIVNIHSVLKLSDAVDSMLTEKYDIVSAVLETKESKEAGLNLTKLVKFVEPENTKIRRVQEGYSDVPLILCEPSYDDDIFAIFRKAGELCHVFPFSSGNYSAAIKHFLGINSSEVPFPPYHISLPKKERGH